MTGNCPCCQSRTCPASLDPATTLHRRLCEAVMLLELWHKQAPGAPEGLASTTESFLADFQLRLLDESPASQG
jgi:hypothetical protein